MLSGEAICQFAPGMFSQRKADLIQAVELVSIGQQTGEVSMEAYTRMALPGTLPPPEMEGLDDLVERMNGANPFSTSDPEAYMPMNSSLNSYSSGQSQVRCAHAAAWAPAP